MDIFAPTFVYKVTDPVIKILNHNCIREWICGMSLKLLTTSSFRCTMVRCNIYNRWCMRCCSISYHVFNFSKPPPGNPAKAPLIMDPHLCMSCPKPVKKLLDLGADLWNEVRRRVGDHSAKITLTLDVQKWLLVYWSNLSWTWLHTVWLLTVCSNPQCPLRIHCALCPI